MKSPNQPFLSTLLCYLLLGACSKPQSSQRVKNTSDSLQMAEQAAQTEEDWQPHQYWHLKPEFGYRFSIRGDFNGDGKVERLTERYFSLLENSESPKYYDVESYDELVGIAITKDPLSYLECSNPEIDSLFVSNSGQLFGLSHLKNVGDLNEDGGDEISYVVDWADWSNLNTCRVMSYQNGKWLELYAFPVWDWQFPNLPGTQTEYGLFGTMNKLSIASDSVNMDLLKELWAYPGLLRKIGRNRIQVWLRNDDGEEELVNVNLAKLKKVKAKSSKQEVLPMDGHRVENGFGY